MRRQYEGVSASVIQRRDILFKAPTGLVICAVLLLGACQTSSEEQDAGRVLSSAEQTAATESTASGGGDPIALFGPDEANGSDSHGVRGLKEAEYYEGSGKLAQVSQLGGTGAGVSDEGMISLNFVDATIPEITDAVLGDILGLNYVIDPEVTGLVTLRTAEPLPRDAVLPTLENVLRINGVVMVRSGEVYSILPASKAPLSRSGTIADAAPGSIKGHGIHAYPMRYASAASVRDLLQPFLGPDQEIVIDEARNLLIFSGTTQEVRNLAEMAAVFDVDWMEGMSFALLPVSKADAQTIVAELEVLFGQTPGTAGQGAITFLPIERLNAVLAISPQPNYLRRAEQWVQRLDRRDQGAGRQVYVYYVKNGLATELAEVLTRVFESTASTADSNFLAPGARAATLRPPPQLAEAPNDATDADAVPPAGAEPGVQPPVVAGRGVSVGAVVQETGGISVIADERTNSLVFLASAAEFEMIEAALERLDITPLQVLIEATIAEVQLNDKLEYGLQWFFGNNDVAGTFSTTDSGAVLPSFPGFNFIVDTSNVRAVLNALTEITDVRIISAPQVMVLDNQSARLQVGDEVPVATQAAVSVTDPDAPIVNSIEQRDSGVILEVTPRINASGLVTLDVTQEISIVEETTTSSINSPTFRQRKIDTTVAVNSGNTVALGGLIQEITEDRTSGIPLLSEIPVLGNLFKTEAESTVRTELLVLITPKVVRNSMEAKEVTEELKRRLSTVLPLQKEIL